MIIGICGFQSSGKDTIADFLIKEYGFKRLSFASALKDVVSIIFGWSRDRLEGLNEEDRLWREQIDPWWSKSLKMPHLSPRYALQYFGTELFRNHWHPDIWVKVVENKMNQTGTQVRRLPRFFSSYFLHHISFYLNFDENLKILTLVSELLRAELYSIYFDFIYIFLNS